MRLRVIRFGPAPQFIVTVRMGFGGGSAWARSGVALDHAYELRETDNPIGIEDAEAAAAALADTLQPEPRVASGAYLDAIGSASRRLEQALGESGVSPFAAAMQAAVGSVEELAADVERNHKVPLT